MFDAIRKHTLIMAVILAVVSLSFVFFGIEGYGRFMEGASKVAEVNGHAITQTEWDNVHRQVIDNARAANPALDLGLLDSPAMKYSSLERLVRDRVLAAAAQDEHLVVSDAALVAALRQDPTIAPGGEIDMSRYKSLLAAQGMTPEGYEARLRTDLSLQKVMTGVAQSETTAQANADVAMNAFLERREASVRRFAPESHAAGINPSEADLESYYKAHLAQYQVPEAVDMEYVVLDLDSIKKSIPVSEQDLKTYYEQNSASLGAAEERRASHILVAVAKDAPAAEREKAREVARKLLADVHAAPQKFAEIAKASSADTLSAENGGDLGYFELKKGMDPAIAQATFKLAKAGEVSDLVETDFGYHIIRLTDIKPAQVPPFEQVRAQLEDQLRSQQAQKQYSELADTFSNTVYEQSDSLKPVADKLKLTIHKASGITRTPAINANGPLANPRFLSALFGTDALANKRNTEAIEVGSNQLASGRVLAHTAAHARPFAEVRQALQAAFVAERSAEAARQEGQARLKEWQADPAKAAAAMPAAVALSRDATQGQPTAVIEAVLRADPAKLPAVIGVDLGASGFAVARVDKVLPATTQAGERARQLRASYAQLWSAAEVGSYYDYLKARYKAKILVPAAKLDLIGE